LAKRRSAPQARSRSVSSSDNPNSNRLLAALPPDDYARVRRTLDIIQVKLKQILHKPHEPVTHVYFPGNGFCSVLTALGDGRMIEAATVGREGAVGVSAILSGMPDSSVTMVQADIDPLFRMTANAYRAEMDRRGAFYELLTRYSQAMVGFVMQSSACNAVHRLEQRLARWLLLARDRVESEQFPMTQEFLAMMLGASRPTVTVVAGTLQKAGLIKYHRGQMTIVDGELLEEASCECYRTATGLLNGVTDGSSVRAPH
jgi:CRP-like cAMP-binding protein